MEAHLHGMIPVIVMGIYEDESLALLVHMTDEFQYRGLLGGCLSWRYFPRMTLAG